MTPEKSGLLDIIMTHDLTRGFAIANGSPKPGVLSGNIDLATGAMI